MKIDWTNDDEVAALKTPAIVLLKQAKELELGNKLETPLIDVICDDVFTAAMCMAQAAIGVNIANVTAWRFIAAISIAKYRQLND